MKLIIIISILLLCSCKNETMVKDTLYKNKMMCAQAALALDAKLIHHKEDARSSGIYTGYWLQDYCYSEKFNECFIFTQSRPDGKELDPKYIDNTERATYFSYTISSGPGPYLVGGYNDYIKKFNQTCKEL